MAIFATPCPFDCNTEMSGDALKFNTSMAFRYGRMERISPNIRRLVAPNPGPFTHHGTGVYVVGDGRVAVIDPGPAEPAHVNALIAGLGEETVEAILVTHTHRDHSPAASLLKDRTGAPVYGFSAAAPSTGDMDSAVVEEGFDTGFNPDRLLVDGETVSGPGWHLRAIHTPGHASGHLCYAFDEEQALFTGDHVMGWSTTVISPPDGDMDDYIQSLEKLLMRDDTTFYPTHGPPVDRSREYLIALIGHRREREAQILHCLAQGIGTIPAIVSNLYADIPTALHAAAAHSVWAHLISLCRRETASADGGTARLESAYNLP